MPLQIFHLQLSILVLKIPLNYEQSKTNLYDRKEKSVTNKSSLILYSFSIAFLKA